MKARRQKGFTLIELMIVVVIAAILVSIAIPSYRAYVIKANRRAAQSSMLDISNLQRQYFVANRAFAANVGALGYSLPTEVSQHYQAPTFAVTTAPPGFTITLTPIVGDGQASDGAMTLNSAGVKTPANKW